MVIVILLILVILELHLMLPQGSLYHPMIHFIISMERPSVLIDFQLKITGSQFSVPNKNVCSVHGDILVCDEQ
jgi:hypothetical protein